MNTLLLFGLGAPEILLIALVVLLLFGGKKIPELMRGLGKGVKSFKDGINGIDNELNKTETDSTAENNEAKP
ncbi:MAG: twin-arginine translocase TatA/TatE family subunit [Prevotellaceae bacterium]|jgi:sec-independent protein translocase protein TatA|nr:twin-arginine translocase TatA/TatE family subunit [Prevotellaceae bacterium]